jgi:hypothetical protein
MDGIAGKALEMANNPSAGVENLATGSIPTGMGGRRKHSSKSRKTRNRKTRRSRRRYRNSRRRQSRRRRRSHKTR